MCEGARAGTKNLQSIQLAAVVESWRMREIVRGNGDAMGY